MLTMLGHFYNKYSVFESYFYCYSATYGPIAMKTLHGFLRVMWHMFFTNFVKFQVLV